MRLVEELYSTILLAPACRGIYEPGAWRAIGATGSESREYVHFGFGDKEREPKPGDLVLAQTGPMSPWKIAFYVEPLDSPMGGALVREIGTGKLCRYENERFIPIVGMQPLDLLDGDRRAFLVKVRKAFRRGGEYLYCFGGLDFDGDEAVITIREKWAGMLTREDAMESVPFEARMLWTKRTSIKAILEALRAGGYGAKEFDRRPREDAKAALGVTS